VALNGDGGDEGFAGYKSYLPCQVFRFTDRIPLPLRRGLASAAGLAERLLDRFDSPRRVAGFAGRLALPPLERYAHMRTIFAADHKEDLYTPELTAAVRALDPLDVLRGPFERAAMPTLLDRMLAADLETYLPDTLLPKMDIASMANSLEARSPFLDHILLEFAARVPARLKVHGWTLKYILRRAARRYLPPEILQRPKQGFGLPVRPWLRGELRDYARGLLLDPRSLKRGHFRPEGVRRLLDEHAAGVRDHGFRLWTLLMLELWHRIFVDHESL
jgi:asparagine synthase (glutamine-hydrolysing)